VGIVPKQRLNRAVIQANVDFALSGLTKKAVYADRLLSTIVGVSEGDFLSYAEISKGLAKYIKENHLRNVPAEPQTKAGQPIQQANAQITSAMKRCRDCGAEIPVEAVFCDLCGVGQ
jgi:ribosomal protein L40E